MTKCHICGRALPFDPTDNPHTSHVLPICDRANCKPEKHYHAKVMSETHDTFWKLLTRLEWEASQRDSRQ